MLADHPHPMTYFTYARQIDSADDMKEHFKSNSIIDMKPLGLQVAVCKTDACAHFTIDKSKCPCISIRCATL